MFLSNIPQTKRVLYSVYTFVQNFHLWVNWIIQYKHEFILQCLAFVISPDTIWSAILCRTFFVVCVDILKKRQCHRSEDFLAGFASGGKSSVDNLPKVSYVCWVWGSLDPDRQDDNNSDTFHTPAEAAKNIYQWHQSCYRPSVSIENDKCHKFLLWEQHVYTTVQNFELKKIISPKEIITFIQGRCINCPKVTVKTFKRL